MHLTAAADYAVRAALALAAAGATVELEASLSADELAERQRLPRKFLDHVLADLRRAGIVRSRRGAQGGYQLARAADQVTIADVVRAVEGPLAEVRGLRPELVEYDGEARQLQHVWVAVRAVLRSVLDEVTLADVVSGDLPEHVRRLADDPAAWAAR